MLPAYNTMEQLQIKFKDNSGKSGSDTELPAESELKFCSVNCQCFPESIEGVWKNANRINAYGRWSNCR